MSYLYFLWECSTEHERLTFAGWRHSVFLYYTSDLRFETHIKHSISFIQDQVSEQIITKIVGRIPIACVQQLRVLANTKPNVMQPKHTLWYLSCTTETCASYKRSIEYYSGCTKELHANWKWLKANFKLLESNTNYLSLITLLAIFKSFSGQFALKIFLWRWLWRSHHSLVYCQLCYIYISALLNTTWHCT